MTDDHLAGLIDVANEAELRELVGLPKLRAASKVRRSLHALDREWLARSPFCLIATAAADGSCDVSPKGDPPGFVHVLDDTTIALPDRPGNRRVDGFSNVLSNPHAGLLFLVPGRTDTLRINGRARLVREAPFFDAMTVQGHRPQLALLLHIDEIFHHCAKAFLRSSLWDPATWAPDALPSRAALVKATEDPAEPLEELERYYGPDYATKLYGG